MSKSLECVVAPSEDEVRELAEAVEAIATHAGSYVSAALAIYRASRGLYRFYQRPDGSSCTSVAEFAESVTGEEWGEEKIRKYRDAGRVVDALSREGFERLPNRESQARELAPLRGPTLIKTWEQVLVRAEKGERLTAALVREEVVGKTAAEEAAEKKRDDLTGYSTPNWLFEALQRQIVQLTGRPFDLDPCATAENAKAHAYFTACDEGLAQNWTEYGAIFCNPPYSMPTVSRWVEKAIDSAEAGCTVVLVVPNWPGYPWMQSLKAKGLVQDIQGPVVFEVDDGGKPVIYGNGHIRDLVAITLGPYVVPGTTGPQISRDMPVELEVVTAVKAIVSVQLPDGEARFDVTGASRSSVIAKIARWTKLDEAPSLTIRFENQ